MSSKKSEKAKKSSRETKQQNVQISGNQSDVQSEAASDKPTNDIRTIVITIKSFKNILPLYPISDIKAKLKYLDKDVGESGPIAITDEERLSLEQSFEISVDVDSPKQLDFLASNPVFVTIIQSSGSLDPSLYEQLQPSKDHEQNVEEVDSLFSLYEAVTGEKVSIQLADVKKKKKGKEKGKKEKSARSKSEVSRESGKSKRSKSSQSTKSSAKSTASLAIKSETYGMCVIDMIPLFYGETLFSETLLIQPVKQSCHILSTFKNFPEVSITVSLKDNRVLLADVKNILSFTVESICNVPSLMLAEMDCKVCAMLPMQNNSNYPTLFYNPKITSEKPNQLVPKRWPGVQDIGYNANTTKYLIESDSKDILNKTKLNVEEGFNEETPRIEFNYVKRNVMLKSGNNDFAARVITYKKLPLEIFLTPKTKKHKAVDAFSDDFEEQQHSKIKPNKMPPYIHLMAILDTVSLLYPGVSKLRTATPVQTFTFEEAAKYGLDDSYFMPKPKVDIGKQSKMDASKKKKPEKKEKTSKKDQASSTAKEDKNLTGQLPLKPEELPAPEPSVAIYNEEGKPCFILLELELLKPLKPKRDIEELKVDLYQLQMNALQSTQSKTILNKNVAEDLYVQTIREIVNDLNKHWLQYNEIMTQIPKPNFDDFVEYLKKSGAYQAYLSSIINSATLLITNKYQCEETDFKNSKTYQNLISEIFTDLTAQMHAVLNSLVCTGMKPLTEILSFQWDQSLFNAKEAVELNLRSTAERYFLQRICQNETIADYWIDFAIFNMEIQDEPKAFECVREAIAINPTHKYSLLFYALLLADKNNVQDSETCLLNLLVLESKWAEGWCILYLFYQKIFREDGMEMALEMSKKLSDHIVASNYINDYEDLAWSPANVPKTLFFRVAIILVKLRLYSWAELALAEEVLVPKHYGYVNYLLAVISYYKGSYEHALEHVEEAKEYIGADFALSALSGHIYHKNSQFEQAKIEYMRVIESYDRPEDIHLVYLNCSDILTKLEEDQKARKLILIACKYHQTPHVWYSLGKLYFSENDLLSAEECFNEANMKDNRHPEVWGYLTLINLKLDRSHEAQQCYQQAVKSKLEDQELNDRIVEEFEKEASLQ